MAYRQYIGARYVPLFDGVWDATKNYEPLTVVEDGNGNSYTSKKDVPAGTPLTNREYWALTATFSGAVQQLQNRVTIMEGVIAGLTRRNRYVVVSDSYGEVSSNFMEKLRVKMGAETADFFSVARGGYGINPAYGNYKFIDLLRGLTVADENTITHVIVAGGFNDRLQTEENILQGIAEIVTYCATRFPIADIYFAAIGWSFNSEYVRELRGGSYISAYKRCIEYGARFLTGCEYIMRKSDLFTPEPNTGKFLGNDYVHPNEAGANAIASGIAEALRKGNTTTEYIIDALSLDTSSNPNINNVRGDLRLFEKTSDGTATIGKKTYQLATVLFTDPIAFDGSTPIEIGMLRSGVIAGQSPTSADESKLMSSGIMSGFVATSESGSVYCACAVLLLNNRVYILPVVNLNEHITAIGINDFNITLDADFV